MGAAILMLSAGQMQSATAANKKNVAFLSSVRGVGKLGRDLSAPLRTVLTFLENKKSFIHLDDALDKWRQ